MTVALAANPSPPIVLSFAASDPTGGAGLQADILTLASLGCHPLSVVTAITVQDTAGVEAVLPIDAAWVADQARALLEETCPWRRSSWACWAASRSLPRSPR
jgi:hydroxymethylpyrimidine/phosphomethylpyrimidine kinase